jgi:cell shape-determining protein MreC
MERKDYFGYILASGILISIISGVMFVPIPPENMPIYTTLIGLLVGLIGDKLFSFFDRESFDVKQLKRENEQLKEENKSLKERLSKLESSFSYLQGQIIDKLTNLTKEDEKN